MALADIAQRAAPVVQGVLEDDEVRDRLQRAAVAGREAVVRSRSRRRSRRRSGLGRAGDALRESGQALVAVSQRGAKRRQRRRRRVLAPVVVLAGAGAAAAVARRREPDR
jgi:hypothetical protein